jgi:hypothetical protein
MVLGELEAIVYGRYCFLQVRAGNGIHELQELYPRIRTLQATQGVT